MASVAGAVDDGGVVLGDHDARGAAESRQRDGVELEADLLADDVAAGEDGDVCEHRLAAVAEARGLDGRDVDVPRSLFTTSVARASPSTSSAMIDERLAGWHDLLERRQQVLDAEIFLSVMRM